MINFFAGMKKIQIIGIVFMVISLIIFFVIGYLNNPKRKVPIIFSEKELVSNLWENYKSEYLEPVTFRTLDKQQNNITTSEGQSYTMLRAVWMADRTTFDQSFKWTQDILKHKNSDTLHAWVFGETSPGKYGVLTNKGGQNSATDAETDIALALIFAHAQWGDVYYLDEAKKLINDIWAKEVISVKGKPVLVANDLERNSQTTVIVNPSYFSPYAYRIFALVDTKHNWLGVVDSSYDILKQSAALALDKGSSAGLPPDWIMINRKTGEIKASTNENLTTNYSYDALRIPWRLALDWNWYQEPRAKEVLDTYGFFTTQWTERRSVNSIYMHDGALGEVLEVPAMYGGVISYFKISDKKNAPDVYKEKLQYLYSPDTNSWRKTLGYYDDNWAWFGIALYHNMLPNLAEGFIPR